MPAARTPRGARHPLSLVVDRVVDVFVAMGYEVAEGPEAEHGWFNFDALNTPPDHASRELQDTLYLEPTAAQVVLRTQTSPVQIRALLQRDLPVYVVCPGRVFRADTIDATHLPVFTQLEGLAVDEGLTMARSARHARRVRRGDVRRGEPHARAPLRTRLRPHFFPFTEPSAEIDLQCFGCGGEPPDPDCRICGGEGWLEWGGCGMVDPGRADRVRGRPAALHRLRVRHGSGAHRHGAARPVRHAHPARRRRALRRSFRRREGPVMRAVSFLATRARPWSARRPDLRRCADRCRAEVESVECSG